MRTMIQQYGRVILITVIFIMFFIMIPILVKQLGRTTKTYTKQDVENVKDVVTFYVDYNKYYTDKMMSWEQWVVSDYNRRANGTPIFTTWEDPCGNVYKVGTVTLTTVD